MKKVVIVLMTLCLLFMAGCFVLENDKTPFTPTQKVFSVENYRLQVTADSTFREATGGSFDLQITNDSAYISIMAYKYMDLPDDMTPQEVLEIQNEDLFSKREAVTVIEEPETQTFSRYVMTRALHSAQRDGVKNYYATYLVDFPEEEVLAWVLVTAMPSYMEENRTFLHNIVCSLAAVD